MGIYLSKMRGLKMIEHTMVTTSKPFGEVVFETGAITISGKRIEIYPKTTFKKESRVTLTIK